MKIGSSSSSSRCSNRKQRLLVSSSCRGLLMLRSSRANLLPTKALLLLLLLLLLGRVVSSFHCPCDSLPVPRRRRRRQLQEQLLPHPIIVAAAAVVSSESTMEQNQNQNQKQNQNQTTTTPLCSVGMIADIQYAPIPDGHSYTGTPRYYRHSLEATKHAFEAFRDYKKPGSGDSGSPRCSSSNNSSSSSSSSSNNRRGVDLVVNLGDIIDGKCQAIERNGGRPPSRESPLFVRGRSRHETEKEEKTDNDNNLVDQQPGMTSLLEIQHAMKPYSERYSSSDCKSKNNTNEQHETVSRQQKNVVVLHSYGNHCLYNLNRNELRNVLGIPFRVEPPPKTTPTSTKSFGSYSSKIRKEASMMQKNTNTNANNNNNNGDDDGDLVGYYSYVYPPQETAEGCKNDDGIEIGTSNNNNNSNNNQLSIKFIVLDSYDISLLRRSPEFSQKRKQAVEILQTQNGKNFLDGNENSPDGLEGLQKRFVAFGGAVGKTQLEWLRNELEETRQQQQQQQKHDQRVVILSHQPIHPGSSNPVCLVWNYESVLKVLRDYSDVVVASFAGHAHKGGYARDDESGIHFRCVEAVLESKPPIKTFGILDVYPNRLELHGYGDCASAVYRFDRNNTNE